MRENKVKEFLSETFGQVRTVKEGEVLWFVAKDICLALEYSESNVSSVVNRLDDEQKTTLTLITSGNYTSNLLCVNEDGLYDIVMGAVRKPKAKSFRKWITKEVIPTLRKDGMYVNGEEDVESVEELNQIVDEAMERKILRKFGIGVRKDWSRTIEDNWNIRNKFQFATYTNELVYKPIFNKTAKQLKKEFEVEKLRDDLFTLEELSNVAKLENEICTLIEFGADYYGVKDYVNKKYKAS